MNRGRDDVFRDESEDYDGVGLGEEGDDVE